MRSLVPVVALVSVVLLTGTFPLSRARRLDKPAPKPAWELKTVSSRPELLSLTRARN
jgi:hypothetical protein